jgi:hypothetical protein
VKFLVPFKDLNKNTHNVSEDGDANEQDKGAKDTLRIAAGMVVSKTNS